MLNASLLVACSLAHPAPAFPAPTSSAPVPQGTVRDIGPGRGFLEIAPSPAVPDVVFGTTSTGTFSKGIFHSVDGGSTYSQVAGFGTGLRQVGVDATGRAYALVSRPSTADGEIHRSDPTGVTWGEVLSPITNTRCEALSVSPNGVGVLWVTVSGTFPWTLWRSADGGATWQTTSMPGIPRTGQEAVVLHPTDPARGMTLDRVSDAIWETRDGGLTWSDVGVPLTGVKSDLRYVYAGDRIVVALRDRFALTDDSGATWTEYPLSAFTNESLVWSLTSDPALPQRVLAQFGLRHWYESLDAGSTWSAMAEFQARGVGRLDLSYAATNRTFVNRTFRRDDATGIEHAFSLPPEARVGFAACALDRVDARRMVADADVESLDGGESWRRFVPPVVDAAGVAQPLNIDETGAVTFDRLGRLLVGGRASYAAHGQRLTVLRRDDSGWTDLGPIPGTIDSPQLITLRVAQSDENLMVACVRMGPPGHKRFVVTKDGGATWEARGPGFQGTLHSLEFLDGTFAPRAIYAIEGCSDCGGPDNAHVFITDDLFHGRQLVFSGDDRILLARSRAFGRHVYLGGSTYHTQTEFGPLRRSTDGGTTWTPVGDDADVSALAVHPEDPDVVARMRGSGGTAEISHDGGQTWSFSGASTGLGPGIAFDVRGERLYAWSNLQARSEVVEPSLGVPLCSPGTPTSSGLPAAISALGSPVLADNDVRLRAANLPANTFGYFLASDTFQVTPTPGGALGDLCLGGAIGRYAGHAASSGALGILGHPIDLDAIPRPTGLAAATAGSAWTFQCWFRDSSQGVVSSNFTDAVRLTW